MSINRLEHLAARVRTGRVQVWLLIVGLFFSGLAAAATAPDEKAQTIVHMLDYVSVDYPEFVKDGTVLNVSEYEEQREFASRAIELLGQLPAKKGQAALIAKAGQMLARIDAKAPGPEVSRLAAEVRGEVMRIYQLSVAPRQAPDLRKAATLFQSNCASCHGAQGRGDGPAAKGMEPQPGNFHEEGRMNVRSIYGLYNTITLGVGGTPMRAFGELSEADRWALAFFAAGMGANPEAVSRGEALWLQGAGRAELGNYRALVILSPTEVAKKGGVDLVCVRAYLTSRPEAIQSVGPAPLEFTRVRLAQSLAAYRAGDVEGARQSAITAYLEGFELIEAGLDNVDATLRLETEREMMALRTTIAQGKPFELVAQQVERIDALLERAQEKMDTQRLTPAGAFVSSLLILLREGLEAILVLSAIIAFVVKTGRRDALPYIHIGWMAAVGLGTATWVVATYVLAITGASREMTEGVSALLAAAMLLYVGYWLHGKSYAQAWQSFIREQVTQALAKRTLWAMAGISFLAVYRELFEIILFYQSLWSQVGATGHNAVLGGMLAAAVLLAVIGWVVLKYSVRLPIGPFFALTSGLLVLMAVVFVGHGTAALQEAGVARATAVNFIALPLVGVRPTLEGLMAQAMTLLAIAFGVLMSRRKAQSLSARDY